ncbi:aldo/keto reductase [Virgibacillus sp. YIM 98842]|uniref:aldo/keto reductase n=1 Tax=Virgibacillus sp. YIM 98842 TaxID=2663533 RepID=UPI0013D9D8FC|nr:aldo/keto reductase [Virgibacillus sp. YIM 98842]
MTEKVTIRGTDLVVNPIGLGTNTVGGQRLYPQIKDETGREILHTAIEQGVDFWDTAFGYGPKKSEQIIGEVLEETGKRENIVLATKAAQRFYNGKTLIDNSPSFLKQSVEDALKRLHTDYIDLFYIHFPDVDTPKYEAVGALKELKDEGKIRAIGVSNFSLEQLIEANKDGYINVYQGLYNLVERNNETKIFPYTIENNISFIPFYPFASGLLAGKYTKNLTFPKGDYRAKMNQFQPGTFEKHLETIEKIQEIAARKRVEVTHLILAWYLKQEAIDAVIPGAKKSEQIISNVQALRVDLREEEFNMIDKLFCQKTK